MQILNLFFCKIALLSITYSNICNYNGNLHEIKSYCNDYCIQQKDTVIVGVAINAKPCAAVRTNDSKLYIMDGIEKWNYETVNKIVKVTGRLVVKKFKYEPGKNKIVVPQHAKITLKIMNPNWKIVK